MLGRATHHVGADVYLGAQEASHLIGEWQMRGAGRGRQYGGRGDRFGRVRDHRDGQWGQQRQYGQQQYGQQQYGQQQYDQETPFQELREVRREEWEALHPGESWERRLHHKREWERQHPGVPFVGVEALMGAAEAAPHLFPPRAALVDARPPYLANREPLPMSTGTAPVGIGLTAQITSRPQRVGFRPERLFVSNFSLDGLGATAWTINDITIGNVSQLAQAGNLPGDMFANVAIDSFVTFKTAQTAMDVVLITTYNGTTEGGIPFTGAVIGLSAQS